MKEVLVTGSSGLVGSRFVELSSHQLLTPRQEELNITNLDSVKEYLDQYKPSLIIKTKTKLEMKTLLLGK